MEILTGISQIRRDYRMARTFETNKRGELKITHKTLTARLNSSY